jgi:hypothetical protein
MRKELAQHKAAPPTSTTTKAHVDSTGSRIFHFTSEKDNHTRKEFAQPKAAPPTRTTTKAHVTRRGSGFGIDRGTMRGKLRRGRAGTALQLIVQVERPPPGPHAQRPPP